MRRDPHERIEKDARREQVERALDRLGRAEHQPALAEIVEQQRGENEREPRQADRSPTEVAQVRVQGFRPRHREDHGAEDQEGRRPMLPEKPRAVPGIQRQEDRRRTDDLDRAEQTDRGEPDQHDRAEDAADPRGAVFLEGKEQDQEDERRGHHVGLESRRRDPEAFGGAEDGDRGRDDAVAIEQRGAEEPDRDDGLPAANAQDQGEERHDPAFAAVVQSDDEDEVLDADDQDQRPDDQ